MLTCGSQPNLKDAAVEKVAVVVPVGGGVFIQARVGDQFRRRPWRFTPAHRTTSEAEFSSDDVGYIYSRYKKFGSAEMDESHLPYHARNDGPQIAVRG